MELHTRDIEVSHPLLQRFCTFSTYWLGISTCKWVKEHKTVKWPSFLSFWPISTHTPCLFLYHVPRSVCSHCGSRGKLYNTVHYSSGDVTLKVFGTDFRSRNQSFISDTIKVQIFFSSHFLKSPTRWHTYRFSKKPLHENSKMIVGPIVGSYIYLQNLLGQIVPDVDGIIQGLR
jgi:hypothetical protein